MVAQKAMSMCVIKLETWSVQGIRLYRKYTGGGRGGGGGCSNYPHPPSKTMMVAISDGSTESDAHVCGEIGNLICSRHSPTSKVIVQSNFLLQTGQLFQSTCAQRFMSYHLIYVP